MSIASLTILIGFIIVVSWPYICSALLLGLITAVIARFKGRGFFWWWMYGAFLFIIALPHVLIISKDQAALDRKSLRSGSTKRCPDCAEIVRKDAGICKYCHHRFDGQKIETLPNDVLPAAKPISFDINALRETNISRRGLSVQSHRKLRKSSMLSRNKWFIGMISLITIGVTAAIFLEMRSKLFIPNQDARSLTEMETGTFLPLICVNQSSGEQNYRDHCTSLSSYPTPDNLGSDTNLTLTSIIYGHMTDPTAEQAYLSYQGDFEPHANDYGGGILFEKQATGWSLKGWYPGLGMDHCLMLTPTGKAKMLCLYSGTGQGEVVTTLWVATIPLAYNPNGDYSDSLIDILNASDDRATGSPNFNCRTQRTPGQAILLSIDNITRSQGGGVFADARITYVAPPNVNSFCNEQNFLDVKTDTDIVKLKWDGHTISVSSPYSFVPTGF